MDKNTTSKQSDSSKTHSIIRVLQWTENEKVGVTVGLAREEIPECISLLQAMEIEEVEENLDLTHVISDEAELMNLPNEWIYTESEQNQHPVAGEAQGTEIVGQDEAGRHKEKRVIRRWNKLYLRTKLEQKGKTITSGDL